MEEFFFAANRTISGLCESVHDRVHTSNVSSAYFEMKKEKKLAVKSIVREKFVHAKHIVHEML